MVETLYRTLAEKGVELKTDGASINFDAPAGTFTEDLRAQLRTCKAEMIDYLTEVEEVASILEIDQGNTPRLAHVLARKAVDARRMYEREPLAHRAVRASSIFMLAEAACYAVIGCGLEIVSVASSGEEREAPARLPDEIHIPASLPNDEESIAVCIEGQCLTTTKAA